MLKAYINDVEFNITDSEYYPRSKIDLSNMIKFNNSVPSGDGARNISIDGSVHTNCTKFQSTSFCEGVNRAMRFMSVSGRSQLFREMK